jgi:uncharacterized DUF497 family protein
MFEWDEAKNQTNFAKHGVAFEEAAVAFGDPMALDGPDVGHSVNEIRFLRVARSTLGNVLTIAYTLRKTKDGTKKIRIISARKASRKERRAYQAEA